MQSNQFPTFFQQAPKLVMYDGLAQFLGATPNGLLAYSYADAVRLCGHSCPTVAGAYLMTIKGLAALYDNDIPERGKIDVVIAGERDSGTAGVVASVATLLTGAATELGFGGIGMQSLFGRRNLLTFSAELPAALTLRRQDTGKTVAVHYQPHIVPFPNDMRELMPKAVSGTATETELKRFGECWQERVEAILVKEVNNPELVFVEELN
ncbi:hypothetical protein F9B74_06350 [Pelistega sp. NLN82]|uniref:Formylmethanofuran dehydrogenase subunit E domain-containing protein n=1 Tax=Pelistega ratti TaxID=2652177 RepID=A0A6L9Y6G5_9BURK|nr:FmdE family protein [Pelistega ratti]NEN75943.1 hypothetical protein [Pelistega ratti]